MTEKLGVNLIDYKLCPMQAALIEWLKAHPYSTIKITAQDGIPMRVERTTDDGMGTETILMVNVAKLLGLVK